MKFTINLKPFPGADYFTVQEHRRNFKASHGFDTDVAKESVSLLLRKFHGISTDYSATWLHQARINDLLKNYSEVVVKDNPATGMDELMEVKLLPDALLDLSYSFPVTSIIPENTAAILVNPRASLGVPIGTTCLFSKTGFPQFNSSEIPEEELYLLLHVLQDLDDKGLEMIIRETNYKAALLYQLIEDSKQLQSITDKKNRSKTMIRAKCTSEFANSIVKLGYDVEISGSKEDTCVVIANYATHSRELIELLTDRILAL